MRRAVSLSKAGFSFNLPSRPSCVRSVNNAELSTVLRILLSAKTLIAAMFVRTNDISRVSETILLAPILTLDLDLILTVLILSNRETTGSYRGDSRESGGRH